MKMQPIVNNTKICMTYVHFVLESHGLPMIDTIQPR